MTLSITWIGQPDRDEFHFVWEELTQTETCTPVESIIAAKTLKASRPVAISDGAPAAIFGRPGREATGRVAEHNIRLFCWADGAAVKNA